MIRAFVFGLVGALVAAVTASAQTSALGPAAVSPLVNSPSLAVAIAAAEAAVATCASNGFKATVIVVNSAGVPVVLLAADGASARSQPFTMAKALVSLKYGADSGTVSTRAAADPALANEIAADTRLGGEARAGGLLLWAGTTVVGAIAVGGAPLGDADVACAKAGAAVIAGTLSAQLGTPVVARRAVNTAKARNR